ncbi:MAG: hypothetical protein IPH53_00550 [Flavobacteriales bacterium]|nr:hypothetical protein [Flavobacteriales bacterium]MBK7083229.1 hypothetical protein [Flavobacteriales bacterium]MBK7270992.1 hypothetical protein [Flavobacteriales bacterium]MBK7752979.1 hypothetical protein [Flavobacteriales bacterium]MBK9076295.1 hypothetical protein [Flavobacteriales bacterium]
MELHSPDKRTYQLLGHQGQDLGRLEYPKWFSMNADILLPEGVYQVRGEGTWGVSLGVRFNEVLLWKMKMAWNGDVLFQREGHPDQSLLLKSKGFWRERYVIIDKSGEERAQLKPSMNWRSTQMKFDLEHSAEHPPEPMHILLAVYAVNYLYAMSAGAVVV